MQQNLFITVDNSAVLIQNSHTYDQLTHLLIANCLVVIAPWYYLKVNHAFSSQSYSDHGHLGKEYRCCLANVLDGNKAKPSLFKPIPRHTILFRQERDKSSPICLSVYSNIKCEDNVKLLFYFFLKIL